MAKPRVKGTTKLEKVVARWANARGKDYDNGAKGPVSELLKHGCQSGMVSNLIYYTDTVRFYKSHMAEIDAMLKDVLDDTGYSLSELFGDKWDNDDPLARDTLNQNLLAWFGFEETARRLAENEGWEL